MKYLLILNYEIFKYKLINKKRRKIILKNQKLIKLKKLMFK